MGVLLVLTRCKQVGLPFRLLLHPVQLGHTRTIPLSLNPVWTNPEERFVVAVGLEDAAKCDLTLEVWDEDDLGQGDFLGQVRNRKETKTRVGTRR